MNRCIVYTLDGRSRVVNAAAMTVANQIMDALEHDPRPFVGMLADEKPDELHKGEEVTIYVATKQVVRIEPIVEDD